MTSAIASSSAASRRLNSSAICSNVRTMPFCKRRPALRRARHEHRAAVAAIRDATNQRLTLQRSHGARNRRRRDFLGDGELGNRDGFPASHDAERAQSLPGQLTHQVCVPEAAGESIERQDRLQRVFRWRGRATSVSGRLIHLVVIVVSDRNAGRAESIPGAAEQSTTRLPTLGRSNELVHNTPGASRTRRRRS